MSVSAQLTQLATYLPLSTLSNEQLSNSFPDWSPEKILDKTGIASRHISASNECASDLAYEAAKNLFDQGRCKPEDIDFILFCTQSPDYILPSSACLLQQRLGIPRTCGALDYNLGCSGFVYGLALAKGLIEGLGLNNVLLLTADTYSKLIHPEDKGNRTLFGDGAAAALVSKTQGKAGIGPFVFGTDGKGEPNLIVPAGGARYSPNISDSDLAAPLQNQASFDRLPTQLRMNGGDIFTFTIQSVPKAVKALLAKANCTQDEVDAFVFHQANAFMLKHLQKKLKIPDSKFIINMENTGNTVSATVPIALKQGIADAILSPAQSVMLIGFGVGYSWAGTIVQLSEELFHV